MESKLKKTSIPENVILGDIKDMTNDDDAVLKEAADTTATQLSDGWLTGANTQRHLFHHHFQRTLGISIVT